MLCPQLLEAAKGSSLLLARDVQLPQEHVRAAFESIRAGEQGYEVLYTVTGNNNRATDIVLCRDAQEAAKVQESIDGAHVDVYALLHQKNVADVHPRRSPPALAPRGALFRREYRVVTREEAEARAATGAKAPPEVVPLGETPPPALAPLSKSPVSEAPQTAERVETPAALVRLTAYEEIAARGPAAVPERPKPAQREAGEKRQKTLFGSPVGGVKHARPAAGQATKAEPKQKKTKAATPKAEKSAGTTSLMKLAKASTKRDSGNNNAGFTATTMTKTIGKGFLDEDEEENHRDSSCGSSRSDSSRCDEGFLEDTGPVLDVNLTVTTNDDIIICDDAPPMVFRAAEPVFNAGKKEPNYQQQQQKKQCDGAGGNAQPKLTGFFQQEVVAFQKAYTREVTTDTVFENGEYICKDVVSYRQNESNEIISEEEYHRRSAEIMCRFQEAAQKAHPNRSNTSSSSTGDATAASVEAARGSRPPKIEKQVRSQPKTLISYFNTASS